MRAPPARPGRSASWEQRLEEQDGVLARRQALASGMSPDQWQWRLSSGRWQPVLLGVAVAHSGPVTARQRSWAAVLHAGQAAALAGDAALVELGMQLSGDVARVDVAVGGRRTVVARPFVSQVDADSHHRGTLAGRVQPHCVSRLASFVHPARELPTMRMAPALLHAAAWATTDRAAEWRVAAAVQQRLVRPQELRSTLAELPRLHRRRLLTSVLDDVQHGAHAGSELDLLRFLRRHRLPAPDRLQRPVRVGGLRYLDAWWERQRVAAELDGAHHRSVSAWEDDVLRANDVLVAGREDGTLLLRFTTGNLRHDAARVAAQLSKVLL
jgi:very-short-patch-repair endonuclease